MAAASHAPTTTPAAPERWPASTCARPNQGRGAGRAMLTWLVDDLRVRGLDPVVLWYFAGNDRAAAVYAAAGFLPDGARRPVPGLDVDEVRVRLATGALGRNWRTSMRVRHIEW